MKISSLNFKNNLRGSAVLSLIHGKEMILKNEVKDFLTKEFANQGFDETIIFDSLSQEELSKRIVKPLYYFTIAICICSSFSNLFSLGDSSRY